MIVCKTTYVNGLHFEILSDDGKNREYDVQFFDYGNNKELLYETKLKKGMWAKLDKKYLMDIDIVISRDNRMVKAISTKDIFKDRRVFISFESESLGDTVAWMPYCEEFRKKYGCKLIVSTFKNFLFEKAYPEIQFVGRGVTVDNIHGMFELGWHFDKKREPINPVLVPLQKAACNILLLDYKEIRPKLAFTPKERPIAEKYVCISVISTAQLKEWYYWQELVDWLVSSGYKVVEVSKDETTINNLTKIEDKSIENVMNYIYHAEFFIGLSSGLSWLAWALEKQVFMIANFSKSDHEFQLDCIRITDKSVCNSCWNNPMFKFDKSSWGYCPEHEDTPSAFICHKAISAERVINEIKEAGY